MTVDNKPLWVLGYGSLIFKPPPHARYVVPGIIHGYCRRFWQSSSDHRGTPENKGRVVTLIPYSDIIASTGFIKDVEAHDGLKSGFTKTDLKVWACAYYIPAEYAEEVSEYLNVREQDGYTIHNIPLELYHDPEIHKEEELTEAIKHLPRDPVSGKHILTGVVYIGTLDNESFVGPESLQDTTKIISQSSGPSGENWEYLEHLYHSLRKLDKYGKDAYLEKLVDQVIELKQKQLLEEGKI